MSDSEKPGASERPDALEHAESRARISHPLRERFTAAYLGLAVIAWGALFVFLLHVGGSVYRKQTEKIPTLSSWSTARILKELGEYDSKIPDCAGMVQGMTGYAYAKFNRVTGQLVRVIIVCK